MAAHRRKKGMLKGKAMLVALVALMGFLGYKVLVVSYEKYQITAEISNLDGELAALNAKNTDLHALIGRLQDKDFIEKEARKKLNLSKAGEKAVIIVNPQKTAEQNKKETEVQKKESNPYKWFRTMFSEKANAEDTAQ